MGSSEGGQRYPKESVDSMKLSGLGRDRSASSKDLWKAPGDWRVKVLRSARSARLGPRRPETAAGRLSRRRPTCQWWEGPPGWGGPARGRRGFPPPTKGCARWGETRDSPEGERPPGPGE